MQSIIEEKMVTVTPKDSGYSQKGKSKVNTTMETL